MSRSADSMRSRRRRRRKTALIERELEGVRALFAQNLTEITRLVSLEREAARLKGERGELVASEAGAKGQIAEIEAADRPGRPGHASEVASELPISRRRKASSSSGGPRRKTSSNRRHPCATGRPRASARRAHGRRRHRGGRDRHVDRAASEASPSKHASRRATSTRSGSAKR